jgi:hypothetical protein
MSAKPSAGRCLVAHGDLPRRRRLTRARGHGLALSGPADGNACAASWLSVIAHEHCCNIRAPERESGSSGRGQSAGLGELVRGPRRRFAGQPIHPLDCVPGHKPRACDSAWPIIATASAAAVITPSVARRANPPVWRATQVRVTRQYPMSPLTRPVTPTYQFLIVLSRGGYRCWLQTGQQAMPAG